MRRTAFVVLLFAGLVPAAALAGNRVVGDGTLSVRSGDGQIRLELDRGVVIGRFAPPSATAKLLAPPPGRITLLSPQDRTCQEPLVWADGEQLVGVFVPRLPLDKLSVDSCVYEGDNLRFRLLGADAGAIQLQGDNISISAVGRGKGTIKGRSELRPDGTWSVNGGDYASLPEERQSFRLVAPPTVE